MRDFTINGNSINSIEAVADMAELQSLNMVDNAVSSLSPLMGAPRLEYLLFEIS